MAIAVMAELGIDIEDWGLTQEEAVTGERLAITRNSARQNAKGSIRSSATRAPIGARRAARCASP
jgi:hypothetical protein